MTGRERSAAATGHRQTDGPPELLQGARLCGRLTSAVWSPQLRAYHFPLFSAVGAAAVRSGRNGKRIRGRRRRARTWSAVHCASQGAGFAPGGAQPSVSSPQATGATEVTRPLSGNARISAQVCPTPTAMDGHSAVKAKTSHAELVTQNDGPAPGLLRDFPEARLIQ